MRCSIQVLFLGYTRIFYCRLSTLLSGFNFSAPLSWFLTPVFAFSTCFTWIKAFKWAPLRFSLCCWKSIHMTITAPGTGTQSQPLSDLPHGEADHVRVCATWVSLALSFAFSVLPDLTRKMLTSKKSYLIDITSLKGCDSIKDTRSHTSCLTKLRLEPRSLDLDLTCPFPLFLVTWHWTSGMML